MNEFDMFLLKVSWWISLNVIGGLVSGRATSDLTSDAKMIC